jgi:hypothetical protein
MMALTDHPAVLHDYRTHHGVRLDIAPALFRFGKGKCHPTDV